MMPDFIEPKEIEITDQGGKVRKFIVSKFPAFQGREICTQYPLSALPKLGDYKANEEILLKMMSYVAVPMPNGAAPLPLSTSELINNHSGDWETLAKLELALMQYNVSFFFEGRSSIFLKGLAEKLHPFLISILTALSAHSSQVGKPPFTS
jgi:hypothetical protein